MDRYECYGSWTRRNISAVWCVCVFYYIAPVAKHGPPSTRSPNTTSVLLMQQYGSWAAEWGRIMKNKNIIFSINDLWDEVNASKSFMNARSTCYDKYVIRTFILWRVSFVVWNCMPLLRNTHTHVCGLFFVATKFVKSNLFNKLLRMALHGARVDIAIGKSHSTCSIQNMPLHVYHIVYICMIWFRMPLCWTRKCVLVWGQPPFRFSCRESSSNISIGTFLSDVAASVCMFHMFHRCYEQHSLLQWKW